MRSAQFGENRSESLETFIDLLLGKDNVAQLKIFKNLEINSQVLIYQLNPLEIKILKCIPKS